MAKQYPHYVKAVHVIHSQLAEVHMVGVYVAVRWNLKHEIIKKTIVQDGLTYHGTADEYKRDGKPYISFESVRTCDGEIYLDEDDPVSGGVGLKMAQQLADELQKAVDYLAFIETMEKVN